MKSSVIITVCLVLAILLAALLFSLSYIPLFNVGRIVVTGFDTPPESALRVLSPLYGENRFRINRGEVEAELSSSPLIEDAVITYSFPAVMNVVLVPNQASSLLYDGESYYLLKDGTLTTLDSGDASFISSRICITEISPEYASYLSRYGADDDLVRILNLANEVSGEEGNLITGIKYDNNSSGAGGLIFYMEPLSAQLCVRDRVSVRRISESIRIIEADVDGDAAGRVALGTRRYDLYTGALVKRN